MKKQLFASVLTFLGISFQCVAGNVAVPHVFSNGQVADAAQVNANFTTLANALSNKSLHYQIVTGDTTLSANGMARVMAINTGANITITLPDPHTVNGQAYLVQKLKGNNMVEIVDASGNIQETFKSVRLTDSGKAELFSDGTMWYLLKDKANSGELIHPLTGNFGILADIKQYGSSNPTNFTEMGGLYYFNASTSNDSSELWVTDGTSAGTHIVADINTNLYSGSNPQHLIAVGSKLFFVADDGTNGQELWSTDGTTTAMVKDINVDANSSYPAGLTAIGTKLYFSANDGNGSATPWVSDGTAGGTFPLASTMNPSDFCATANGVVFVANSTDYGYELFLTDGTAVGTNLLVDLEPGTGSPTISNLTSNGSIAFFKATDSGNGSELWKTDGTAGGTSLVKDIVPGSEGSSPENFVVIDNLLYFSADDINGIPQPWVSDGTASGTHLLVVVNNNNYFSPKGFCKVGNKILFVLTGEGYGDLFAFDLSTQSVEDLGYYGPISSVNVNGKNLYLQNYANGALFEGNPNYNGNNLYFTNGTKEGTLQIVSSTDAYLNDFRAFSNTILFNASDKGRGYWGYELYILSNQPAPAEPATSNNGP